MRRSTLSLRPVLRLLRVTDFMHIENVSALGGGVGVPKKAGTPSSSTCG